MPPDFLQSMGAIALGSRLKRAGVAMQAASQAWLDAQGFPVPATHMPLLAALHQRGPLAIGVLAQMMGIAQPGVTRMSAQLEAGGWVSSSSDGADRRVRQLQLTEAGQALTDKASVSLWPRIGRVVEAVCAGLEGDFLEQMTGLEQQLEAGRMAELFREAEGEE